MRFAVLAGSTGPKALARISYGLLRSLDALPGQAG